MDTSSLRHSKNKCAAQINKKKNVIVYGKYVRVHRYLATVRIRIQYCSYAPEQTVGPLPCLAIVQESNVFGHFVSRSIIRTVQKVQANGSRQRDGMARTGGPVELLGLLVAMIEQKVDVYYFSATAGIMPCCMIQSRFKRCEDQVCNPCSSATMLLPTPISLQWSTDP